MHVIMKKVLQGPLGKGGPGCGNMAKKSLYSYRKDERLMLYQISNGCVKFAADTILEHINFEIRNTEKIAVVGRNGCGKTTLLS